MFLTCLQIVFVVCFPWFYLENTCLYVFLRHLEAFWKHVGGMLEPNFESTCQKSCLLLVFLEVVAVAVWFYMFFSNCTWFYVFFITFWNHFGRMLEQYWNLDLIKIMCNACVFGVFESCCCYCFVLDDVIKTHVFLRIFKSFQNDLGTDF